MFIILVIIFLALGISLLLANYYDRRHDSENGIWWLRGTFGLISTIAGVGCLIALCALIPKVAVSKAYDTKIEIIEETNRELEEKTLSAVKIYLEHEEIVYDKDISMGTVIGIFNMYPELKSNKLIEDMMNMYQENANEIKQMKFEKTNLAIYRFLVYFGV